MMIQMKCFRQAPYFAKNLKQNVLCLFLLYYSFGFTSCDVNYMGNNAEPIVETSNGRINGIYTRVLNADIASFLGIPFGKPPIEDRRFSKPEPIDNWEGILPVKEKSPICMQYSSRNLPWIPSYLNKSEDCLYLNIWTPRLSCGNSEKLSVMVWIHGGGFTTGSASMDLYDGSALAYEGNVVVVNMNYRLGVFGFLNGGSKEAPGNIGLHDQLLALKWINTNIENFCGNPKQVTLFGESCGSVSVNLQLISPLTEGLFQKAILESNTAYHHNLVDDVNVSINKANKFAEIIGCSNNDTNFLNKPLDVINCLKKKDSLELVQIEDMLTQKFLLYFIPFYGKTCESCNDFLPESPIKIIQSNKIPQMPTLVSVNNNEGSIFLAYILPEIFAVNQTTKVTLLQVNDILKSLFSVTRVSAESVFDFYFKNVEDESDIVNILSTLFGDYLFVCPSIYFAEKAGSYLYWMNHVSKLDKNDDWIGATHFTEVQYVFGKPIINMEEYTAEDKEFSKDIIKKWSTFADKGYPIEEGTEETWPKFSLSQPMMYEFNSVNRNNVKPFSRMEACEFWKPYITNT